MTEKEERFNEIAKQEAQSKSDNIDDFEHYSYYVCPDQYVGKIKDVIKKKRLERKNIEETNVIEQYDKIIILILESPHQDEFESDKNVLRRFPIGPANGVTGVNIWKFSNSIFLRKIGNWGDCALLLMNAIPFQCSLGVDTEHFRYDVFKKAWDDKNIGADFFKDRLAKLLNALSSKKFVIVNACTKGYNATNDSKVRSFLWRLVQESIEKITLNKEKKIHYFRINHPSSWSLNEKNRKIKEDRVITFYKTEK